jgi:hypothetical protein
MFQAKHGLELKPDSFVSLFIELLTPWPESASGLYQPSDRRVSAKIEPPFSDSIEIQDYGRRGSAALAMRHPSPLS